MFTPAHDVVVLYAIEPTPINDTVTPSTMPTAPTTRSVLGWTNLPDTKRGLNNSKGYAIGKQGAAYNKRGAVKPSISVEIRPTSIDALANLFPANGVLPTIALWVVVRGQYNDLYRYAKASSVTINASSNNGDGGEVTISVDFEAITYQRTTPAITLPDADIAALGTPLFWHDVRQFDITDTNGDAVSYRKQVMSLSVKQDLNLERKNQRPNWGDNNPLSRTSYALLEHTIAVSGEIGLHDRLPEELFTDAATAQDWGDIIIHCSDDVGQDTPRGFTLTMSNAFPSDEAQSGGDANAELDHTIPFTADSLVFAADEDEG